MKKIISLAVILIIISGVSTIYGQNKEEDMAKKEQELKEKEFEKQHQILSEATRAEIRAAARAGEEARTIISSGYAAPSFVTTQDGYMFSTGSRGSSSQLSMSKSFNGESKKAEGSFEVDDGTKSIKLSLLGSVDEGEIKIKISLSNGDVFKEMTIDESADIQFSQNLVIDEDETKYFGKWKYVVESVKAKGNYRLTINTR